MAKGTRDRVMRDAWIGDAVLTLFVRIHILDTTGAIDGEESARMTSNRFLNAVGEPSLIEAQIGREYLERGLPAAFRWIEEQLIPVFRRQSANRKIRETRAAGANGSRRIAPIS